MKKTNLGLTFSESHNVHCPGHVSYLGGPERERGDDTHLTI